MSYEVEQLYQQRNHLLDLIERFEHSNRQLSEYLRHQYHLEAEDGHLNEKSESFIIFFSRDYKLEEFDKILIWVKENIKII